MDKPSWMPETVTGRFIMHVDEDGAGQLYCWSDPTDPPDPMHAGIGLLARGAARPLMRGCAFVLTSEQVGWLKALGVAAGEEVTPPAL